jgi:glutaconate CoA-transferase subunit B
VSVAYIREHTGWPVRAVDVPETPTPTGDELAIIRRLDPHGFWTRQTSG